MFYILLCFYCLIGVIPTCSLIMLFYYFYMCLVPLCFVSCSFLNGLSHICIQILCVSVADTDEGILIYFETGLSVVFNLLGFLTGQPVYILNLL